MKTPLVQEYSRLGAGKMWTFRNVRILGTVSSDAEDTDVPIHPRDERRIRRCIANESLRGDSWSWGAIEFLMDTSGVHVALVAKYLGVAYETVDEWYHDVSKVPADAVVRLRPYFWRKIFKRALPDSVHPESPDAGQVLYDATIRMGLAETVESQNVVY